MLRICLIPSSHVSIYSMEELERLEIKVSYLENLVDELNKAVIEQDKTIMVMQKQIESLEKKVEDLIEVSGEARPNRRPPHY